MRFWIALLCAFALVGCSPSGQLAPPGPPASGAQERPVTPAEGANARPSTPKDGLSTETCDEVLAEVQPGIGSDWVQTDRGPCWLHYEQQGTEYYLSVAWSKPDSPVYPWSTEPIQVGRYQGRLGHQFQEKTGDAFWGPTGWSLEVTGERGRITITCGMQMAPNLEEGKARQLEVDARCPELLKGSTLGNLGPPVQSRDLWLVSPENLLAGRTASGRHYALHSTFSVPRVSPDGRRVLLNIDDTSRMKRTYPVWVEVLDLYTGEQWRLTEQSDWWTAQWLPDGRAMLFGSSRAFLSDPAVRALEPLIEPGARVGYAFDGREQVAWAVRPPTNKQTSEFQVRVLNLTTGKVTEYPGRYQTRVSPKAGAPMALSPEGDSLAFVDKAGGKGSLVILTLATQEEARFEVDPSADVVGWDPGALWVRYMVGEAWQVGRFDAEGHETARYPDFYPRLSPDGEWATIDGRTPPSEVERGKAQPGLLNLATGEVRRAPVYGYVTSGWAPTGEVILVEEKTD